MKSNLKSVEDLIVTKRRLPHYQSTLSYYFITSHFARGVDLSSQERDIVFDAIKFLDGKKYDLISAVVMPDHFHLLLRPLLKDDSSEYFLAEINHSLKSYTSHQCKRKLWQHESFDRTVRGDDDFVTFASYIQNNHVKKGLINENEVYKWYYVFLRD